MGLSEGKEHEESRPDLSGRLLVGTMWEPGSATHSQLVFEFSTDTSPLHGTLRGGPILFGTFIAAWEGEHLRIDWKCTSAEGFFEGSTFATVESMSGGRVRIRESWIDAGPQSRPGFLSIEEAMTDES